jgi:release factor glutamine methyltransferase
VIEPIARLRAAGCVFAEEEAALIVTRFPTAVDREKALVSRCGGTPLELVLGEAAFAGVTVSVERGVFLPRRRAEVLVDIAVERGDAQPSRRDCTDRRPVTALDLGCGAGAIAAALSARRPHWSVHASDVAPAAVRCARSNAERFGFTVHAGNWFDGLPPDLRGTFDVVVAHLPYVPTSHLPLLPRDYRSVEPNSTVDGGPDGLDPWRAVVGSCGVWMARSGWLITQVTADQEQEARQIADRQGMRADAIRYDDSVVVAASPADGGSTGQNCPGHAHPE